ncbi:hypothetical protein RIF29_28496 [Crotalaria pallida]|uniref:Uncharacterized protein n=1 Tax=Crotalaria pallida TaxID=3830 RepID=A0AAN9EJH0_CROPI
MELRGDLFSLCTLQDTLSCYSDMLLLFFFMVDGTCQFICPVPLMLIHMLLNIEKMGRILTESEVTHFIIFLLFCHGRLCSGSSEVVPPVEYLLLLTENHLSIMPKRLWVTGTRLSDYVYPLSHILTGEILFFSPAVKSFSVLLTGEIDSPSLSLASPLLRHSHSHLPPSISLASPSINLTRKSQFGKLLPRASSPCVFSVHLLRVISLVLRVSSPR